MRGTQGIAQLVVHVPGRVSEQIAPLSVKRHRRGIQSVVEPKGWFGSDATTSVLRGWETFTNGHPATSAPKRSARCAR